MKFRTVLIISLFLSSVFGKIYSQNDPLPSANSIESKIEQALDYFTQGEYELALNILNQILRNEPENKRASDLVESINELYHIDQNVDNESQKEPIKIERPDFNKDSNEDNKDSNEDNKDSNGDNENGNGDNEEMERPDFSVRDDSDDLLLPEDGRTKFELYISPNFLFQYQIGEEGIVFPVSSDLSANFMAGAEYYLELWNRILGFSADYSIMVLNPSDGSFGSTRLHTVDAMLNFRTFFVETFDSRIIFKLGLGYRGYFSGGYNFNSIDRNYLHGINMGVALELPLFYLIWEEEFFKNIIFDVDLNLLFFPDITTFNLFDFTVCAEYRFDHFSVGLDFGAYTVITTEDIEYIWKTGLNIKFHF